MSQTPAISRPVQRYAALGIAAALMLAGASVTIVPIVEHSQSLDRQLDAAQLRHSVLKRLEATAAQQAPAGAGKVIAVPFLPGETPSIQHAALQARLRALAGEAGVRIQSASAVQVAPRHGFHLTGVQLSLRAPMATAYELLARIEQHQPPLLIEMVELHPIAESELGGEAPRTLDMQLRVAGLLREEATKP